MVTYSILVTLLFWLLTIAALAVALYWVVRLAVTHALRSERNAQRREIEPPGPSE